MFNNYLCKKPCRSIMIRTIQYIILIIFLTISPATAQENKIREATEKEVPFASYSDCMEAAEYFLQKYYYEVQSSVDKEIGRRNVIKNIMTDKMRVTYKTEFAPSMNSVAYSTPGQYLADFEREYGHVVDDIDFVIENEKYGKIMKDAKPGCHIAIEYDLTFEYEGEVLFKRRCQMGVHLEEKDTYIQATAMQVEPIEEIIPYNSDLIPERVPDPLEEKYMQALQWYREGAEKKYITTFKKLAKQDYAPSQYMLGICYYNGDGEKQDIDKAVYWFEKAARQGHPHSQRILGDCYYNSVGKEENFYKAAYWYEKAAEQEDANAQYDLGLCYYNGVGKEQDLKKAIEWFEEAAAQGHEKAKEKLKNIR